ncbi:MAG TPA: hypothetical protein VM388_02425 [Acidimicrobiales bacterium]|nr:hypothetical protein [Acidimicrobiales bacterium]
MKRSFRVLGTAAVAAIGLLTSGGAAHADTVLDTGMVTVEAQTRAVRLDVGGITVVSVNKVSNPGVQVRVTVAEGSNPVVSTVYAAGENGCSAEDNVAMGTLNRSITVQGGPWANIYVKAQFTSTTPIGLSTTHVLEPLGPTGLTVNGVTLVTGVPINICVA